MARTVTVTVYLNSGQTVVLDHLKKFNFTRGEKVEWESTHATENRILSLPPENIAAITYKADSYLWWLGL